MSGEKKAMWVVFKMETLPDKEEMRSRFSKGYHIFRDHPGIESKCWYVNEAKDEWGAFYLFKSEKDLDEYLNSKLWVEDIPKRWGLKPEVTILDPGPVLSKKIITEPEDSWLAE